jgi:hypothetical protein
MQLMITARIDGRQNANVVTMKAALVMPISMSSRAMSAELSESPAQLVG